MQILKTNIVFAFGKLVCQTQCRKYPHVNGVMCFLAMVSGLVVLPDLTHGSIATILPNLVDKFG